MDVDERARKNASVILQRLASAGQVNVAKALNVSEATISRKKDGEIEEIAKFLAVLGLKAVPIEMRCYNAADIDPLLQLAKRHLQQITHASQLAFDDPE